MYTGALPTTSVFNTWSENVEIISAEDDTLMDLDDVTEIVLRLIDPYSRFWELQLSMTNGDITIPSPGVVQWRAERGAMGTLMPKTYELVLIFTKQDDEVVLILGSVSVVE